MAELEKPNGVWSAGETLGGLLGPALAKHAQDLQESEYEQYRRRAIRWRGKRKKLLPEEMEDPKFFEMRACGASPANLKFREWFFDKRASANDRRDLVMISRSTRVRYCSPEMDAPDFKIPKLFLDICPNTPWG